AHRVGGRARRAGRVHAHAGRLVPALPRERAHRRAPARGAAAHRRRLDLPGRGPDRVGAAVADGADLGGAEMELSEHAARNRAEWNVWAADYVEAGHRHWAEHRLTWGITSVPEDEARVLPELEGRDVLE